MARPVFMGIDVSKGTLDISIDNKHQHIENAEKAISEFIKSNVTNSYHPMPPSLIIPVLDTGIYRIKHQDKNNNFYLGI